ncbi:comF family protein [Halpernia humi]|uniref:ComF family protein n=1 Tax=Halpernia humi TaxID=493375 RepID=A0A1H5Z9H6_9FLAO|nr:phosphoribosyltransferase family protein [Halpernia humi]SEG32006.1 comF family protein [Halpernia humi]
MFLDFFFPDRCLGCNNIIAANIFVCEICKNQIDFCNNKFEDENVLKEQCKTIFPIENAFALMRFQKEGLSRELIHNLKYNKRKNLGKLFAKWTIERLSFDKKPDLLISVPLHPKKEKERGYNQLHLFTETISEFYNIPFDHQIIKRNYYAKAQALKDKENREKSADLFSLQKPISGKHVLIIDDVFTTGNTMSAMAWEILKNKNNKVSVLVMEQDY